MAGRAVYTKLAGKFGAKAAKSYLYGDAGASAFESGDLATVGKIDKIQKFFGHDGFSSQRKKTEFEKDAKKQNTKPVDDRVFNRSKFKVKRGDGKLKTYNGFIDQYGQKYVAQPNGGLVKMGKPGD